MVKALETKNRSILLLLPMDDFALCTRFCTFWHITDLGKYIFLWKSDALYELLCHINYNNCEKIHLKQLVRGGPWTFAEHRLKFECEWSSRNRKLAILIISRTRLQVALKENKRSNKEEIRKRDKKRRVQERNIKVYQLHKKHVGMIYANTCFFLCVCLFLSFKNITKLFNFDFVDNFK